MDPSSNQGLYNAKLHTLFPTNQQTPAHPPPSYHMVVDPNAPIPNLANPYDPEDEEKDDEEELPEITINASTQIRGHGNIISVPQMDAARIASLLHTMIYGPPSVNPAPGAQNGTEATRAKIPQRFNITVNCGAVVVGDRNVVGPGLSDIARQVQATRNQAAVHANRASGPQSQTPPAQTSMPTPESSRRSSEVGENEATLMGKRKAEEDASGSPEPKRREV